MTDYIQQARRNQMMKCAQMLAQKRAQTVYSPPVLPDMYQTLPPPSTHALPDTSLGLLASITGGPQQPTLGAFSAPDALNIGSVTSLPSPDSIDRKARRSARYLDIGPDGYARAGAGGSGSGYITNAATGAAVGGGLGLLIAAARALTRKGITGTQLATMLGLYGLGGAAVGGAAGAGYTALTR